MKLIQIDLPKALHTPVFPAWWQEKPHSSPQSPPGELPFITVITPSFNQAPYLESTIRSVLEQGYVNLEYFVIDGGSTDGSVDIIRHYEKHLAWWVSEPDRGQTDAIGKGLKRATGEWCNWINSDDLLAPGALWRVAAATKDADVVAGPVQNFSFRGVRGVSPQRRFTVEAMIFQHLGGGTKYHQPGIWLRREGVLRTGIRLDRHYKFDYELLLRYLQYFPRVRYLDDILAYFRLHEDSKTVTERQKSASAFHQEHADILRDLADDPDFSGYRDQLKLAARQCHWLAGLGRYAEPLPTRWHGLYNMWKEIRQDPEARCIRYSRRVALRMLREGIWPRAWTTAVRRRP